MDAGIVTSANPAVGIVIFMLGGLAGAIFYLPFKKVKNWAWESYWLVYALFGLVIVPWVLAFAMSPNVITVLKASPANVLWYCFICGALWGIGGLTWGLMIRYLGFGLGLAIGCGLTASVGTLVPKALKGEFSQLLEPGAGITSLIGIIIALVGIVLVGLAGMSKERELSEEEKKKAVAEFNFKRGIFVAIFSGIMSGAMGIGLQSGGAIEQLALTTEPFTSMAWKGMPVLVVVLLGGFVVNGLWCIFLNVKNKSTGDYVKASSPIVANIILAAIAGAIWCSQFICFKTGEPKMGDTSYIGWTVLMASSILFSQILGLFLGEWKGTSKKTVSLLSIGLILLIMSAIMGGYSGYLDKEAKEKQAPAVPVSIVLPN
ncbi:MAG: hypothetical protein LLF76_03690 [Planctomycetaceae bacterium]|nr:hypothetical protein [Planctomycetaceae bacterium]